MAYRAPLPPQTFDWIGLCEPTVEEMERVRRQYGLHPLAVEDALNPRQLPKVEAYGKQLFAVARTASLHDGEIISYGQTAFFLGADFIISVRFGSTRAPDAAPGTGGQRRTARRRAGLRAARHSRFHRRWLPADYRRSGRRGAGHGGGGDRNLPRPATIRRIFRLRRQLRRFERVIGPMQEMCARLVEADLPTIDPAARIWFRDVLDHVHRALTRVRGVKETLARSSRPPACWNSTARAR
jgi:magnesium transporter